MTTGNGFGPKTSELASANNVAITVKAEPVAPIAADASAKWETFTARPAIAATGNALSTIGDSLKVAWKEEQEDHHAQRFFVRAFEFARVIALPIISLLWLALNYIYQWSRKPETKAAAAAKWQVIKDWAAPKFGYEREADRQVELNPND